MARELTKRQGEVLEYIQAYVERENYPPTVREIGEHFKMAKSSVFDHLKLIEKKGYLARKNHSPRSLELKEGFVRGLEGDVVEIPILGRVAAGKPLLAVENLEGSIKLDRFFVRTRNSFALRVKGSSMIEAGILDGDFVIVKQQPDADRGEIVVALIEDEVTVKYYYPERDVVVLKPANIGMTSIIVKRNEENVRVLGKVVGVYRKV